MWCVQPASLSHGCIACTAHACALLRRSLTPVASASAPLQPVPPPPQISDAVLFLGKIAVSCSCAFFCFVYLDEQYPAGTISSPILPVIIVFLAAFAIACMFFAVVEMVRGCAAAQSVGPCEGLAGQALR